MLGQRHKVRRVRRPLMRPQCWLLESEELPPLWLRVLSRCYKGGEVFGQIGDMMRQGERWSKGWVDIPAHDTMCILL
jgi:hypothetical protein